MSFGPSSGLGFFADDAELLLLPPDAEEVPDETALVLPEEEVPDEAELLPADVVPDEAGVLLPVLPLPVPADVLRFSLSLSSFSSLSFCSCALAFALSSSPFFRLPSWAEDVAAKRSEKASEENINFFFMIGRLGLTFDEMQRYLKQNLKDDLPIVKE
jgi:hypothetical protein